MRASRILVVMTTLWLLATVGASAAQLSIVLPLKRVSYQTNEQINLAVVRQDAQALAASNLTLTMTGDDASVMTFTFPVAAVPLVGNDARTTEHLVLNGWLLRPGRYTVQAACDGATAQTVIQIFTHIRNSTYRLLHWWSPGGEKMAPEGENGFGFNTMYGGVDEPSVRAGEDIMGLDLMGGGHQFDLKMTNDWSDPYVYIGADQRALDRAFSFRTMPNAIGAHLYDEPGLTYAASRNGQFGPWDIAPQRRAYKSAFGEDQMWYDEVKPDDPANMAKWNKTTEFRLGFMDAFWKSAYQSLGRLKPGYLVATQSQYGWWALFDGYYFNVARTLPVISGHGGYDDYGQRNFNPSYYVELSLPRQMDKPTWYLGDWGVYANEQIRQEHYLAFIAGIQGVAGGPSMGVDSKGAAAGVESNKAMARLGTIFSKPAYTRQDVALLYSKSDLTHATRSKDDLTTVQALGMLYTATRMIQYPITAVLEEDILDGSAAANHKVILMSDIQYLDPNVITGLQAFMQAGGAVLMTDDCTVSVPGAKKIGFTFKTERGRTKPYGFPDVLKRTQPLADALKVQLAKLGLHPAFGTSAADIAPGRQVRGDIEYIFAVNFTTWDRAGLPAATVDEHPEWSADASVGNPFAIASTITLPDDGRPVYDGMRGGSIPFVKKGKDLSAALRFGPGQMRVFVRTARPIGGVQVGVPVITRDYTRDTEPLTLDLTATLVDNQKQVIAGSAPMEITVTDPLGEVRYHIYRATDQGVCKVNLPLAANDPSGAWTVTVKELLNNTIGTATFTTPVVPNGGAVVGKTRRAVFYQYDKANIYQMFRNARTMTIVAGTSAYNQAAAERLAASLKPYNVICTIVSATDANKARPLTDEEAATWCGMSVAGGIPPDQRKNPQSVGFDLPGPSILLGNPQDNPLIRHLTMAAQNNASVLPYPITADFPGRGRGYLAWNLMALGHDLETVACIANDAEGMSEAVGTLFELAIGIDPVTPYLLPAANSVQGATKVTTPPAAPVAWQSAMPDTITGLMPNGATIIAASWDGSMTNLNAKGESVPMTRTPVKLAAEKPSKDVSKLPKDKVIADLAVKQVLTGETGTAVAYLGGTLQIFAPDGTLKTQQRMPQDITAMLWQGNTLVIGLAEGNIVALTIK